MRGRQNGVRLPAAPHNKTNILLTTKTDNTMTQNEFYALTGVQVENDEFWAINEVYNRSDMDKYDFCSMWRKMNRSRVDAAKAQARAQEQRQHDLDVAWRLLERWQCKRHARLDVWSELCTDHMTAHQEQCLNRLGIVTRVHEPRFMGFVFDDIVEMLHNA